MVSLRGKQTSYAQRHVVPLTLSNDFVQSCAMQFREVILIAKAPSESIDLPTGQSFPVPGYIAAAAAAAASDHSPIAQNENTLRCFCHGIHSSTYAFFGRSYPPMTPSTSTSSGPPPALPSATWALPSNQLQRSTNMTGVATTARPCNTWGTTTER